MSEGTTASPAALEGIRVLDAAGPMGAYCGKLFADMGADVILVEPPAGSALRREPPFIGDMEHPESGIAFTYCSTSERGITLNLDEARGQALFLKLCATAHLVIETEKPGVMARRGLGYAQLAAAAPAIVLTSITPFGQTGPYADFESEDLIGLAMGGLLNMMGDPDIAPTRAGGNQAFAMASMFGAVASMLALLEAQSSGAGQHVDVSMQECVVMALENAAQFYDLEGTVRRRFGGAQRQAGTGTFACKDGYVYIFAGGMAAVRFWGNAVRWLIDGGAPGAESLDDPRWSDIRFLDSAEAKRIFSGIFSPFALRYTKAELYYEGQRRRVPICPVSTAADIAGNRQLQHRSFFAQVMHAPSNRVLTMPGAPYRLSETPWRIRRPAPRLGEHNAEIYGELGVAPGELRALARQGVI